MSRQSEFQVSVPTFEPDDDQAGMLAVGIGVDRDDLHRDRTGGSGEEMGIDDLGTTGTDRRCPDLRGGNVLDQFGQVPGR